MKQQAIDILDEMISTGKNLKERCVIPDANCYTLDDMTEMLEEAKSRIQALDGWIPLDREYPPIGDDVLVYSNYDYHTMCVDGYVPPNNRTYRNGFSRDPDVTHWMPLPLPPNK